MNNQGQGRRSQGHEQQRLQNKTGNPDGDSVFVSRLLLDNLFTVFHVLGPALVKLDFVLLLSQIPQRSSYSCRREVDLAL